MNYEERELNRIRAEAWRAGFDMARSVSEKHHKATCHVGFYKLLSIALIQHSTKPAVVSAMLQASALCDKKRYAGPSEEAIGILIEEIGRYPIDKGNGSKPSLN